MSWWCKLGLHKWRIGPSEHHSVIDMFFWLEQCTQCGKTVGKGKKLDMPFFTFVDPIPPSWEEFYGS